VAHGKTDERQKGSWMDKIGNSEGNGSVVAELVKEIERGRHKHREGYSYGRDAVGESEKVAKQTDIQISREQWGKS
jgi:hypothetical protein